MGNIGPRLVDTQCGADRGLQAHGHRLGLDQLESEMMAFSREWDRAVDGSPNRLDAMVWGLTRLSKVITQIPIA